MTPKRYRTFDIDGSGWTFPAENLKMGELYEPRPGPTALEVYAVRPDRSEQLVAILQATTLDQVKGEEARFPLTSKCYRRISVGDFRGHANGPETAYEANEKDDGLAIYRVSSPAVHVLAHFACGMSLDDVDGEAIEALGGRRQQPR